MLKKLSCFKIAIFLYCIKISEKTLKCNDVEVNKKEFHGSKQLIALNSVLINKIVVSDKFKHSDEGFKYFIGYKEDISDLYVLLPQISGYIKRFHNGGKNMSFKNEDDYVLVKYNES